MKASIYFWGLFFYLFLYQNNVFCQELAVYKKTIIVKFDQKPAFLSSKIYQPTIFSDSLSILKFAQQIQSQCYKNSYYESKFKFSDFKKDTINIQFNLGAKIKIGKISIGNLPPALASIFSSELKYAQKNGYNHNDFSKCVEALLVDCENNGLPFASIALDSIYYKEDLLYANLLFTEGPLIKYDTLLLVGKNLKTKRAFLENYLKIKKGQTYDERKVKSIYAQLNQIPFIQAEQPIIYFADNKAIIEISIKERNSNFADGVIGFLPNANNSKQILFTGEFNLQLLNLFGKARSFKAEWKSFQKASQLLNLEYNQPNFLSTAFDIGGVFQFFKQDSSFFTLNRALNIAYRLPNGFKFTYQVANLSSRIGSSSVLKNATSLPAFADYNIITNGLALDYLKLDHLYFTKKGKKLRINFSAGNKIISKNSTFKPELYDKISLKSPQFKLQFLYDQYVPIKKNATFLIKTVAGKIFNKNLLSNDLYRLGGLKSLRGFNENFFYASDFAQCGVEFRQYFDQNSYLMAFAEQSYLYYSLPSQSFEDTPFAAGGGISFLAGPGVFSFVYALGKSKLQTFSWSQSKVHFGFVSRF